MIPRVLLGIALLVGLGGCSGSALVWYGHTPDRAHRVELRQMGGVRWLRVAGRSSHRYSVIATRSITLAPRGRWAFAAARPDGLGRRRWHVVTAHGEGPAWEGVADLRFAPRSGTLVYAARSRGGWRLVTAGRPGASWDAVVDGSVAFSPDGHRMGYLGVRGACVVPVIDDHPGRCEHDVVGLALGASSSEDAILARGSARDEGRLLIGGHERGRFPSPRGLWVDEANGHWAVLAAAGGSPGWHLVVDGRPGPPADDINHVTWAPDGGELAYVARFGPDWFVVRGAVRSEPFLRVQAPVFSPDGRHLAFIGRTRSHSELVLDGRTVWRAPTEAAGLRFAPAGRQMAWIYRDASGIIVAVGNARFRFDVAIEPSLRFSADGRHWAVLAGSRSPRRLFIVVDGTHELPFDTAELFGGGLGGANLEQGLGDWVEAELARFLAEGPPT